MQQKNELRTFKVQLRLRGKMRFTHDKTKSGVNHILQFFNATKQNKRKEMHKFEYHEA